MSSSNKDVISGFYNRGSKIIPVGPDLRYIGKLPTSHNHNFEEEYLLGEDKRIKRWYGVDSNNQPCYREEIRYGSAEDGYYWLDYFEYDMRPMNQDVTYNNEVLTIDVHSKFNLPITEGIVLRKYNLYWHKNNQDELFSSKIVKSKTVQDSNSKKWIEIINHTEPMSDDVLFENGMFNPLYVGNNFTFPTDVVRGQFSTIMLDDRIKPYMINNLPFQAAGEPAPLWTIENGMLVMNLAEPVSSNELQCAVYIPVDLRRFGNQVSCLFEISLEGKIGGNAVPYFVAYQVTNKETGDHSRLIYQTIGEAGNTSGFERRGVAISKLNIDNLDYIGIQSSSRYSKISIKKIQFLAH